MPNQGLLLLSLSLSYAARRGECAVDVEEAQHVAVHAIRPLCHLLFECLQSGALLRSPIEGAFLSRSLGWSIGKPVWSIGEELLERERGRGRAWILLEILLEIVLIIGGINVEAR